MKSQIFNSLYLEMNWLISVQKTLKIWPIQGLHQSNTSFFMTCQNLDQNTRYKSFIMRQMNDFIIWPYIGDHPRLNYLSSQMHVDSGFL